MDILGLFGINIIEEIQNFFGSILAWLLGLLEELTGINLVDN